MAHGNIYIRRLVSAAMQYSIDHCAVLVYEKPPEACPGLREATRRVSMGNLNYDELGSLIKCSATKHVTKRSRASLYYGALSTKTFSALFKRSLVLIGQSRCCFENQTAK